MVTKITALFSICDGGIARTQSMSFVAREAGLSRESLYINVANMSKPIDFIYFHDLYLNSNPEHRLTPGLPADAVIRWKEETPWAKPLR